VPNDMQVSPFFSFTLKSDFSNPTCNNVFAEYNGNSDYIRLGTTLLSPFSLRFLNSAEAMRSRLH